MKSAPLVFYDEIDDRLRVVLSIDFVEDNGGNAVGETGPGSGHSDRVPVHVYESGVWVDFVERREGEAVKRRFEHPEVGGGVGGGEGLQSQLLYFVHFSQIFL